MSVKNEIIRAYEYRRAIKAFHEDKKISDDSRRTNRHRLFSYRRVRQGKVEEILAQEGVVNTDHLGLAAMVAFGYRKEESSFPRTRLPLDELVEWVR